MHLRWPATVLLSLALATAASAVDKAKAVFVGGSIAPLPPGTEGSVSTTDETHLLFVGDRDAGLLKIPWKAILELEYGQEVSRSAKKLFVSKSRQHFLTLVFRDEQEQEQSIVLELGKDLVRPGLAAMEARSGRKVTYQDEEAARMRK
jgi:hypothetical protein